MGSKRRTESHLRGVLELLGSKVKSESHSAMSDSSQPQGLYSPWNSPGQNPGVGSLSLLQGIFLSQRSNPGLPYCWWILYQLSHTGSSRRLEWVACSFSSRSSQPRNRTRVSCIAGWFFTNRAISFGEVIDTKHCRSLKFFQINMWNLKCFPSNFNFYIKWKWSLSVMSDSLRPHAWSSLVQATPSMGFSRQENWSGLPFPSPGNLPDPGIEPRSPAL